MLLLLASLSAPPAEDLARGEIVERVSCIDAPDQSYALYLPSGYTPERRWPVVIALDPVARGREPLKHFGAAAESLGFILAGSNNSRNGPVEPSVNAVVSIWNDVQKRFAIDVDRIYLAGFSGGGRMVTHFALKSRVVAGAVACGAGLLEGGDPELLRFDYVVTAGLQDMNYLEVRVLVGNLQRRGSQATFLEFDGGHDWPPPEIALRALKWLKLQAMRRGLEAKDGSFIEAYAAEGLDAARKLEDEGSILEAHRAYQSLVRDLEDLGDVNEARGRSQILERSPKFKEARRREQRAIEVEQREIRVVMKEMLSKRPSKSDDWWRKKLNPYREIAERELPNAAHLSQRLFNLVLGNAVEKSWFAAQQKDYERALRLARIAVVAKPESVLLRYRLARMQAFTGHEEEALEALEKAFELGFEDRGRLAVDEAFANLRQSPRFEKLLGGS